MSGTVQSEGRVVGYSAYEVFLRHFLSENPGVDPPTEREWLASSITMGNSLLVKVNPINQTVDQSKVIDIPIPEESRICAPGTIIASLFTGEAHYPEGSDFATKIISYGSLIQNDADASPAERVDSGSMLAQSVGREDPVPYYTDPVSDDDRKQMEAYLSIVEGVVLQPGTWKESGLIDGPAKEFSPDLTKSPTIRLRIRGPVANTVQILLTGFTLRGIVQGEAATDVSSLNSDHPFDGDYLGPTVFPWASKIIFSVPSYFMSFMMPSSYTRKFYENGEEASAPNRVVQNAPIVDFADMFTSWSDNYTIGEVALKYLKPSDFSTVAPGLNVLALANESANTPPAMYAGTVDSKNKQVKMSPVDTVAPGTVKVFESRDPADLNDATNRATQVSQIPGNLGMFYNHREGTLNIVLSDSRGSYIPHPLIGLDDCRNLGSTARSANSNFPIFLDNSELHCLEISTPAGSVFVPVLPVVGDGPDAINPTVADITNPATRIGGIIGATELMRILTSRQAVDLFGDKARKFLSGLPILSGERISLTVEILDTRSTGEWNIRNSAHGNNNKKIEPQMVSTLPIKTDAPYIVVGGRRLYVSSSAPTGDIPEGSLGIGW